MRLLVKVGGAQLSEIASRTQLAQSIRAAHKAGHEVILVHGGGDQIRTWTQRLGIPDNYHEGLRITDADTASTVLAVLGGEVNRWLVASLTATGLAATGLTGADGPSFYAKPRQVDGVDLGFVGDVCEPQPKFIESLLGLGVIPVLATVAPLAPGRPDDNRRFYNINADHCAGPLAAALRADAVLFLTNVPGVLDADKQRIDTLTPQDCDALRAAGVIHGGMIPKVQAAKMALAASPCSQVVIAPAHGSDAVCAALRPDVGTAFTAN